MAGSQKLSVKTMLLLQSSFLLQALKQDLMPLIAQSRDQNTSLSPAIVLIYLFCFTVGNLETTAIMGTDGSAGTGTGALDPHDCEAAHYVVTNHRPGSVHLTARCSFLGPDTQVSLRGGCH